MSDMGGQKLKAQIEHKISALPPLATAERTWREAGWAPQAASTKRLCLSSGLRPMIRGIGRRAPSGCPAD
jgi:hypothetical protein